MNTGPSSNDAKSPWTETLKALGKFINVFICCSCKSVEGRFQVTQCCNGYFCRKCLLEKEECPECRSKLKIGENLDLNVPLELCTKLLAVLNMRFETGSLTRTEISEVLSLDSNSNETTGIDNGSKTMENSGAQVTRTANVTEGRDSSLSEDDEIDNDDEQFGVSNVSESRQSTKQSLAAQKPPTFSGFLKVVDKNVGSDSSNKADDDNKREQKWRKRKREDERADDVLKGGDVENDAKKRKCKSSRESKKAQEDKKTSLEENSSPNADQKVVADSLLMLGEAPILTTKDSDITPASDDETPRSKSLTTPSRSSNLSRNSSAFLTPASECKQPGGPRKSVRPSTRKPPDDGVSVPKKIPSRDLKTDLNSTLDSYFAVESSKTSKTPAGRQQRAKGANSVRSTPNGLQRGEKSERPIGSKKGDGVKRNKKGETVLHTACIKGNLELARQILKEGMDPNVRDYANWTPLHEACNHGHDQLVQLLLDHGADVNATGGNNCTPLHDSAMNGQVECVRILVERGADANRRNDEGHMPTFYATNSDILRLLQENQKNSGTSFEVPKVAGCLRPGKVVITTTGLEKTKRSWLMRVVGKLGWSLEENITEDVTHVITSTIDGKACQRTLKYMLAVLMGKWIVTEEWLKACETNGDWTEEGGYEVSGCSARPDSLAPSRSRANDLNKVPGIFSGCSFFLSNSISANGRLKAELTSLVKHSSGRLLLREPKVTDSDVEIMDLDTSLSASATGRSSARARQSNALPATVPYHATSDSPFAFCSYFVVHDALPDQSGYSIVNKRLSKVTPSWIYDCISSLSLVYGQRSN